MAVILGAFFLVLAVPVTLGTAFAVLGIDRGINLVAGLVLGAVGGAFLRWGGRDAPD